MEHDLEESCRIALIQPPFGKPPAVCGAVLQRLKLDGDLFIVLSMCRCLCYGESLLPASRDLHRKFRYWICLHRKSSRCIMRAPGLVDGSFPHC